jgi:hypothetical protein
VEVDAGRSLARAVARLLSEDAWALFAAASAAAIGLGLFVRWLARAPRARVIGGVVAGVAVPVLLVATVMAVAARRDRQSLREAVVVSAAARPTDERGITLPGATPLAEGARVEIIASHAAWTRVRFGATEAWLPTTALRELARLD